MLRDVEQRATRPTLDGLLIFQIFVGRNLLFVRSVGFRQYLVTSGDVQCRFVSLARQNFVISRGFYRVAFVGCEPEQRFGGIHIPLEGSENTVSLETAC